MILEHKPQHRTGEYLELKLKEKGWDAKMLAVVSGVGESEISNFRSGITQKLKAETFYRFHTSFGDSCSEAIKIIYPNLDLTMSPLKELEEEERTKFGQHMKRCEKTINSYKEISLKTGIPTARLYTLYYSGGAIEANELILVELAVKAKMGSIFKTLYKFKKGKLPPAKARTKTPR